MSFQKSSVFLAVLGLLFLLSLPLSIEAQEPTGPAAPAEVRIDMLASSFDPETIVVQVNATVTWNHRQGTTHDVTGIGNEINSPNVDPGGSYQWRANTTGVYDYYCTYHSTGRGNAMWGRLIVMEAPLTTLGGEGGISPEQAGVNWLAHWVGIISFVAVFATLIIYYFVLKFGETMHATDHRDRKEP